MVQEGIHKIPPERKNIQEKKKKEEKR